MKRKHVMIMCVALLLHSYSYAQKLPQAATHPRESKPSLFSHLPEQFSCDVDALQKLLAGETNEQIIIQLSSQFLIIGKIVDKSQHNPGSFSINVRLENYKNALFNLSVRLMPDNSVNIQGRILHPRYSDLLVLQKDKDKYSFSKKEQRLYMPE